MGKHEKKIGSDTDTKIGLWFWWYTIQDNKIIYDCNIYNISGVENIFCNTFWKKYVLFEIFGPLFIRCNGNPVVEHLLTDTFDACLNQCKSHPVNSSMEGSVCSWITYDEKTKFCQLFEKCDPPNLNTKLIQEDWYHLASERGCPAVPDCYFQGKCQVWSLNM